MNRHKKMQCKVCHARTHKDIMSMSEDEGRKELRRRNDSFLEREEKIQKIEEIVKKEEIDISTCIETQPAPAITQSLEEDLLNENLLNCTSFLIAMNQPIKRKIK